MRSMLDHAHDAFIALDAGGLVIDWNLQALQTFGWSAEEAVGQVLADPASESAAELAGRADAALDEAEAQGRDRTVVAETYGGRHSGERDEGDNAS